MRRARSHRHRLAAPLVVLLLLVTACGGVHWPGMPWQSDRPTKEKRPAPIDLNRASLSQIEALPGVTPTIAKRIVEGRPYEDAGELVRKGILSRHEYHRIDDLVTVESK